MKVIVYQYIYSHVNITPILLAVSKLNVLLSPSNLILSLLLRACGHHEITGV